MEPYYDRDGVEIYQGDVLEVLRQLPDGIVQTCVTSPPYWGLRCYGTEGQLGLEPTPEAFIAKMVEVFAEVRRVLRDDGTLWLNLGDSYAGGGGYAPDAPCNQRRAEGESWGPMHKFSAREGEARTKNQPGYVPSGLKPKDLCGIPWRVALALQADGWYLRSDIIWHKPNPMPESCTDRPTKAHEYIFLLSKKPHYYYDADAVREEAEYGYSDTRGDMFSSVGAVDVQPRDRGGSTTTPGNGGTRNRRTVWTVATAPYSGAHFATFPPRLIEPCILAGATDKACSACGKPWRRVVEATKYEPPTAEPGERFVDASRGDKTRKLSGKDYNEQARRRTVGHAPDCKCDAATRPSIVLDPFMGSGTTAWVARKHGCNAIGIELNSEYIDLAAKRLNQGVLDFA